MHRNHGQEGTAGSEERDGTDPVSSTVAASEERSSGKGSPDTGVAVPTPTTGSQRLTAGDLLTRIFPTQRRPVLDLVLQGCDGDVLKAIEHFLSLNDSIFRHQHHQQLKSHLQSGQDAIRAAVPPDQHSAFATGMFGSPKSAFTPLNHNLYSGSHMPANRGMHMPCQQPPFPFSLNREMLANHFNPAVHFLLNQPGPAFSTLPAAVPCPPGCTQCPPIGLGLRTRSESSCSSAYKVPVAQDGAVDLTSDGQTAWRSSPSCSAPSKRSE